MNNLEVQSNNVILLSLEQRLSTWAWASIASDEEKEGVTKVVERVKQAFLDQASDLDLSFLDLKSIPSCIGELKNLKFLQLNGNKLSFLPDELGELSQLQFLALDYNRQLKELPPTFVNILTLKVITCGGTGISQDKIAKIVERNQAFTVQDKLQKEKCSFQKESLLFSQRPEKVQEEIDRVYALLQKGGVTWGYKGNSGLYGLLNFDDCQVICQRIENASPDKKDLYFIDLGAGHCSWVDSVSRFLHDHYRDDKRNFHVIGVTGDGYGTHYDDKKVDGNVITHKISGFKVENLLESFEQLGLPVVGSVEFIVSRWTLCHLVDPLGTLEQAYHLLTPGNGFIFGTGFESYYAGEVPLNQLLAHSFGIHNYITKRRDSQPDDFALYRAADRSHSDAKRNFKYNEITPIASRLNADNCFAQCSANLQIIDSAPGNIDDYFGGGFHGFGTYVLEKLLGYDEKFIEYNGKIFIMPLFGYGCSPNLRKEYLGGSEYQLSLSPRKFDQMWGRCEDMKK